MVIPCVYGKTFITCYRVGSHVIVGKGIAEIANYREVREIFLMNSKQLLSYRKQI